MQNSVFGRLMAFGIILLVVGAIIVRVQLTMPDHGGDPGLAMWELMRFFTILTKLMVAVVLFSHLMAGGQSASRLAGMTLAICIVGVVYHLLLARLVELSGTALIVDHIFHTAVPILTFLWWAGFAPKSPLGWYTPVLWLLWPLAYAGYAIARGYYLDGVYPYYFLNLAELGPEGLAISMGQFLGAFAVAGYVLWGLGRLLGRQSSPG